MVRAPGDRQAALCAARSGGRRSVASGHRSQSRCLHPVHALPARLPRRAGQRRDRHRVARRRREDRVRHGRPHGRVDLRGLRRMRAGLPDRRADAGPRRRAGGARQAGAIGLPVLRRRLPADLSRQGQPHPIRGRARWSGQSCAALRQGPLRLRLRRASAPPDGAAGAPRGRAQARRCGDGSGARDGGVPRGDVGGGAGAGRRRPRAHSRYPRQARAGRLRLGQGQQRGGLSVPEAGADRLRQQQRRPLHAAVPCLVGGGAARRDRLGRGVQPGDRCRQGRGRDPDRRQSDRQSPGRGELDQERGAQRHQADRRRSAPLGPGALRLSFPAVPAGYRCRAAQRDDACDRHGRAGRSRLHREPHDRLRRTRTQCRRLQPRGDGTDLRHRRRDDPPCGAALRDRGQRDDPVGHGRVAARAWHRQCALPDRAGADDGPDRPARHRPASAARPEQCAGRLGRRADSDDVSGLPARRRRRRRGALRSAVGHAARSPAGFDGGRGDAGDRARRGPRHVHHGREPGDVGPRRAACARGAGRARSSGWCRTSS